MATVIGYHMRMRLEVERVIAKTTRDRRELTRIVYERTEGSRLLTFNAADTHPHLELADPDRGSCLECCRRIAISWRRRHPQAPRLITLPPRPIETVWHLHNTFGYVLDQPRHHQCEADLYHEASALPDLLGLRVTGRRLIEAVRQELPRVRWSDLWERLGPVDLSRPFGSLDRLADAAAAAVALPDLVGTTRELAEVKRAAVLVASPHLTPREIADLLPIGRRRVEQIQRSTRQQAPDEALVRAVELQLRFRSGMDDWLRAQSPEHRARPEQVAR